MASLISPTFDSWTLCFPQSPTAYKKLACETSSPIFSRFFRSGKIGSPDSGSSSPVHRRTNKACCDDSPDNKSSLHSGAGQDLVHNLCKSFAAPSEDTHSHLQGLLAEFESPTRSADETAELVERVLASGLLETMLTVLPQLDFETRKDLVRLFQQILKVGALEVYEYARNHTEVLLQLLDGCGKEEVALNYNMMIRSCAVHSNLVAGMLEAGFATALLKLAESSSFEISSDAFTTLRELLTSCKSVAAAYLQRHFKEFFCAYNKLQEAEEYLVKRQALRLLADLLLDRYFKQVMLLYVREEQFLQMQMNLLRDDSASVQVGAFHIFKIFVGAPRSSRRVHQILFRNSRRLIDLIDSLDGKNVEGFEEDRSAVVDALQALQPPPPSPIHRHTIKEETEES